MSSSGLFMNNRGQGRPIQRNASGPPGYGLTYGSNAATSPTATNRPSPTLAPPLHVSKPSEAWTEAVKALVQLAELTRTLSLEQGQAVRLQATLQANPHDELASALRSRCGDLERSIEAGKVKVAQQTTALNNIFNTAVRGSGPATPSPVNFSASYSGPDDSRNDYPRILSPMQPQPGGDITSLTTLIRNLETRVDDQQKLIDSQQAEIRDLQKLRSEPMIPPIPRRDSETSEAGMNKPLEPTRSRMPSNSFHPLPAKPHFSTHVNPRASVESSSSGSHAGPSASTTSGQKHDPESDRLYSKTMAMDFEAMRVDYGRFRGDMHEYRERRRRDIKSLGDRIKALEDGAVKAADRAPSASTSAAPRPVVVGGVHDAAFGASLADLTERLGLEEDRARDLSSEIAQLKDANDETVPQLKQLAFDVADLEWQLKYHQVQTGHLAKAELGERPVEEGTEDEGGDGSDMAESDTELFAEPEAGSDGTEHPAGDEDVTMTDA